MAGILANSVTQTMVSGDTAADSTADGDSTDLSDAGLDPDPNGSGDPGDAGEDDPTTISLTQSPVIGAATLVAFRLERTVAPDGLAMPHSHAVPAGKVDRTIASETM